MIIAAGHSLWFKHFFNTFLGKSVKTGENNPASDARDCKVKNGKLRGPTPPSHLNLLHTTPIDPTPPPRTNSSNSPNPYPTITSGGAVGFNLECGKLPDGTTWYRVDNESIEIIEGGFDNAKKLKKAKKKAEKEAKKKQ